MQPGSGYGNREDSDRCHGARVGCCSDQKIGCLILQSCTGELGWEPVALGKQAGELFDGTRKTYGSLTICSVSMAADGWIVLRTVAAEDAWTV